MKRRWGQLPSRELTERESRCLEILMRAVRSGRGIILDHDPRWRMLAEDYARLRRQLLREMRRSPYHAPREGPC
jgi:hypothetical protein